MCEIHRVHVCLLFNAEQPHTSGDNSGGSVGNRTQVGNAEINLELNSSSARQLLCNLIHTKFFLGGVCVGGGLLSVNRRRCVVCACARVFVSGMLRVRRRMDILKWTTRTHEG